LQWFPSFGPMQFAVGGAFAHTALWGHLLLLLGLAWAAAFTAAGLVIFRVKTRSHRHQ
jgi:ABC-2 type transport system permease protein